MRAIQLQRFGGPEVLELVELPDPEAAGGSVALDVSLAGINFADTHKTENGYLAPQELPLIPGMEVAGRTAAGERVVALLANGGYAERAIAHPVMTFEIPEGVSDHQALALTLQGITAWHLLRTCGHFAHGQAVVVFAAAGGVGSTAIQLARAWGAGQVIAVASSPAKRELALELGADAAVDSNAPDLTAALLEANDGQGVDVVLEMTGGPTFEQSLEALAPFGRLVHYGTAGRAEAPPVDPSALMRESRAVIGFWLTHCSPTMLRAALLDMFEMVEDGKLDPLTGSTYPLAEATRAHQDLLARRTTGKLALECRGR